MATSTPKGLRRVSNTDVLAGHTSLSNLADDIDGLLDKSVANTASLPASGNWIGRSILVTNIQEMRYWDGSAWLGAPVAENPSTFITAEAGWTITAQTMNFWGPIVQFRMEANRSSAVGPHSSGNLVNIHFATITDPAFWPVVHAQGWATSASGVLVVGSVEPADGKLLVAAMFDNYTISAGTNMSFSSVWMRNLG